MFGLLTSAVENVLDMAEGLCYGELPSKRQVARLIDAGLTIYSISEATGFAEDVIRDLAED